MGTQKNRLNERVLLSTQNKCLNLRLRKYSKFYAQKLCSSKAPLHGKMLQDNGYILINNAIKILSEAKYSLLC